MQRPAKEHWKITTAAEPRLLKGWRTTFGKRNQLGRLLDQSHPSMSASVEAAKLELSILLRGHTKLRKFERIAHAPELDASIGSIRELQKECADLRKEYATLEQGIADFEEWNTGLTDILSAIEALGDPETGLSASSDELRDLLKHKADLEDCVRMTKDIILRNLTKLERKTGDEREEAAWNVKIVEVKHEYFVNMLEVTLQKLSNADMPSCP